MGVNLFDAWKKLPSGGKRRAREFFYEGLARFRPTPDVVFMNFGYAEDDGAPRIELSEEDERNRYALQLYNCVARQADWRGLDALEVGSGRGGGASYVMRTYQPKSYLGVDLAKNAIDFCQRTHHVDGLRFQQGDAMNLPLADSSVDLVINIESSGLYPKVARFYREVHRVLRPGGRFLCADYRKTVNLHRWHEHIEESDLNLIRQIDITENVARALVLDRQNREEMISAHVPAFLRPTFLDFAGLPPDQDEPFGQRKKTYLCFELQKPAPDGEAAPE
ncbi:MAG: methyltransferase domain-containing protein [Myxococcota bacterium]